MKYGVAGLNIDGGRVEYPDGDDSLQKGLDRAKTPRANIKGGNLCTYGGRVEIIPSGMTQQGRFPANIILTYPKNEYILKDNVTPEQLHRLAEWMNENTKHTM